MCFQAPLRHSRYYLAVYNEDKASGFEKSIKVQNESDIESDVGYHYLTFREYDV